MLSCPACKRLLREDSQSCPFCGVARVTVLAPIVIVVALGVALAACGPSVVGGDGGSTSEDPSSTGVSGNMSATADDGPITAPGTNNTTAPDPTTVGTSITVTATATDPTTTDGDDDVIDDEGCAFYGGCPFDGGGIWECDLWAQDCAEGEKCMPWANDGGIHWNATRCSPFDPSPNLVGEPCTVEGSGVSGIDDCEIGAMCWDVDPATNEGTCVAMCSGTPASPACADDSGTECMMEFDGVINVCLPLCNPLLQDCTELSECVPSSGAFFCVLNQSGPTGFYGDGCAAIDACEPGLFCAPAEAVPGCVDAGCCTEFCDLALPDPSSQCTGNPDGVQCQPFYDEGTAPAGYEFVGACVLPD